MGRRILALTILLFLLPVIEVVAPGLLGELIVRSPEGRLIDPWQLRGPLTSHNGPAHFAGELAPVQPMLPTGRRFIDTNSSVVPDRDNPTDESATGTENVESDAATPTATSEVIGPDAQPVDSTPSSIAASPDMLTGDVSGRVTGTLQLVGEVNLVGDLVVDGGTLLARPGVSVEGNGFQIEVTRGGRLDWQGTPVAKWSDDGSLNVVRDITVNGVSRVIFKGGAGPSTLRFASITNSGKPELGFYPMHWHLNGDSTRGTLIEGVAVVNGANHAFVPHGSHGITFLNTVAKTTSKSAFWWDAPGTNRDGDPDPRCQSLKRYCTLDNSHDIVVDGMVIDGVTQPAAPHRVAAFVLGAGKGNVIRDSLAMNVQGGKDCSGFHWPESANLNEGGTAWTFLNNEYSGEDCHGVFVWQNDDDHHVVDGFSGGGVDHGAYRNFYEYRNISAPYLEIHAVGWKMTDSDIGSAVAAPHVFSGTVTFSNVQFESFALKDNGGEPATYVLEGTNLSCGEIDYSNAHPNSAVTIDGDSC